MNIVIVPSHNQEKNISKIIKGYEKQTVVPDLVLFVFDRCSDNSRREFLSIKTKLNISCLIKTAGNNFSAGMTRDFGVDYVMENFPEYKTIIFTDGDCIPSERLVELHLDCLSNSSKPAVSSGRRIMRNKDGNLEEDERLENKWTNDYSFTDKNARLLISSRVTLDSIFTYSCNLAFNKRAIELCRKINFQISNSPRVFNPQFDGSWGGEDNFISDCLFRTGNDILLASKDCYVEHIWHPESDKSDVNKKRQIHKNLSNYLYRLIVNGDILGEYVVFEKNRNIGFDNAFNREINNIRLIQKDDRMVNEIINKIKFPYDLSDREIIFCKYILARNRMVVPATQNNPKLDSLDDKIEMLYDFLTFTKIYLRNDEYVFEESEYVQKKRERSTIETMLNSSKRI